MYFGKFCYRSVHKTNIRILRSQDQQVFCFYWPFLLRQSVGKTFFTINSFQNPLLSTVSPSDPPTSPLLCTHLLTPHEHRETIPRIFSPPLHGSLSPFLRVGLPYTRYYLMKLQLCVFKTLHPYVTSEMSFPYNSLLIFYRYTYLLLPVRVEGYMKLNGYVEPVQFTELRTGTKDSRDSVELPIYSIDYTFTRHLGYINGIYNNGENVKKIRKLFRDKVLSKSHRLSHGRER